MSFLRLCPLFAVIIFLTACSHQNPIVGTWSGSQTFPNGIAMKNTWTFTADGKNTMQMMVTSGPRANIPVSSTGTYATDGSTLTQTVQTMSESGRTRVVAKPIAMAYPYTLNGNTLTITMPNVPTIVLTRQSSS